MKQLFAVAFCKSGLTRTSFSKPTKTASEFGGIGRAQKRLRRFQQRTAFGDRPSLPPLMKQQRGRRRHQPKLGPTCCRPPTSGSGPQRGAFCARLKFLLAKSLEANEVLLPSESLLE
jgi:hypothetical protein